MMPTPTRFMLSPWDLEYSMEITIHLPWLSALTLAPLPGGRGVLSLAPLLPREKGSGDEGLAWMLNELAYS